LNSVIILSQCSVTTCFVKTIVKP